MSSFDAVRLHQRDPAVLEWSPTTPAGPSETLGYAGEVHHEHMVRRHGGCMHRTAERSPRIARYRADP